MSEPTKIFQTEDKAQKTVDGFENFAARLGVGNNNSLSHGFYAFNLLTRNRIQLEAGYRGSWVVGRVVDSPAEDMTRAGINITTNDAEDEIKDIQAGMSRKKIWQSLKSGLAWGDLYGGALSVIQIQGQKLDTPLDYDTIGKDQFLGLAVFDRWQLNPDLTSIIQEGPDLGLPEYYFIVSSAVATVPTAPTVTGEQKVHHSRVIRHTGIDLPYFQAITEMMWGESVLERLWDRLIAYDTVTMSAANLIERANNRIIKVKGLREIIAAGGKAQDGLVAMMEMVREFQTNEGLTLIDMEDEFQSIQYTFSGLDLVLIQFGQQLSGASQIPMVRLFGQSPQGMNATGESDMRMYYDYIAARQESKLRGGTHKILKCMWQSTYEKPAPKDLEFTFVPLWQMSALDKATIAKSNTETILGAEENGTIDRPTAMKELRQMSGDTGLFSNITDEDITEAEEEPPPEPMLDPAAQLDPANGSQQSPKEMPKVPVKNLDSKFKRWFKRKI